MLIDHIKPIKPFFFQTKSQDNKKIGIKYWTRKKNKNGKENYVSNNICISIPSIATNNIFVKLKLN